MVMYDYDKERDGEITFILPVLCVPTVSRKTCLK